MAKGIVKILIMKDYLISVWLIGLAVINIEENKMTKEQRLEQYGATSDIQIIGMIDRVCDIFGNGSNGAAKINIEKLIRHESHFGNIKDRSKEYGEGLVQFDRPTFKWILEKLEQPKYAKDRELFKKHYGFPLSMLHYEDLRNIPETSIALCRLRFRFIPSAFPIDYDEMFPYYKKHWNGGGAATIEKWNKDTKDCYFKVGM